MQAINSQANTVETLAEKEDLALRILPVELKGVLPEMVWSTLTLDQKKEMLRHHNIFDKYLGQKDAEQVVVQDTPEVSKNIAEIAHTVTVEKAQNSVEKVVNEEFDKVVSESKQIEKERKEEDEKKPVLSKDELERIRSEKAQAANIKGYNFFGYQPQNATITNAKTISDNNPVSDGKTWAATLIAKIFSLFQ
ncbi:hypothetical protein M0R04_02865 [Candidatus Dojkabacteria bacterium]|jgi:hypothetical protein|nr:hypothetical protein [Candidatus Dojkabacteria bacterium]